MTALVCAPSTTTSPLRRSLASELVVLLGEGLGVSRRLLRFEEYEVPGAPGRHGSVTLEWIEALRLGLQPQQAYGFIELQPQVKHGRVVFAPMGPTYTTDHLDLWDMMSRPRGYTWQDRLQRLRDWRGDEGEADRLSASALATAADLASYAEQRFAARGIRLTTVLSGLGSGGVQIDWTVRVSAPHYYLEIEIPPDEKQPIVFLRTRELPDGTVLQAHEVRNASMAEAIAEIEKLALVAERTVGAASSANVS